jgi:hypothetical protein
MTKTARGLGHKTTDKIEKLSEFVDAATTIRNEWFDDGDAWGPWFRGQQRASWGLCPKLFRGFGREGYTWQEMENEIREEYASRAPVLSETRLSGSNPWDWYFQMQHFGAPTRLLDWTEGALIGLYFAVRDNPGYYDAAVWALDPYELNRQATGREDVIPPSDPGVIERDRKLVDRWLPPRFSRDTRIPGKPVAVYPTHLTRRISTQRSCFTVHGTDLEGMDRLQNNNERILAKIVIPSFCVREIRRELETQGIDEVTVFPDLDGLGRATCARWRIDSPTSPHAHVYTRLRPSTAAKGGVGVFAIRKIKRGTNLFQGENEEMLWVQEKEFSRQPKQIRKLYDDFAVAKDGRYGCPQSFNRLTIGWYLNEPGSGAVANVRCAKETYDFFALRDIREGEELTVDYPTHSDSPIVAAKLPKGTSPK